MSISLCMITRDEEKLLKRCLESARPLADEIIIVDTGSTDNTKNIASGFADKLIDYKWDDDFSSARNLSLKHASKEWILVMDSDELMPKESLLMIRILLKRPEADAYRLNIRNFTNSDVHPGFIPMKHETFKGYYEHPVCRLFRNNPKYNFYGFIHEGVENSIMQDKGRIEDTSIILNHMRELKGKEKEKHEHYFALLQKEVRFNPGNARAWEALGIISQNFRHDFESARKYYGKAISINPMMLISLINLSHLLGHSGGIDEAGRIIKLGLQSYPGNLSLLNNLSFIRIQSRNFEDAEQTCREVLKADGCNRAALLNLGFCCVVKKDFSNAILCFKKILEHYEDDVQAMFNMALVMIRSGDCSGARRYLEKALKLDPSLKKAKDLLKKLSEPDK